MRCNFDGTLSTAPPECAIRPPVAKDQNRTVLEESDRNTAVGDPVIASLEADEQMEFSIIDGDPGGAFRIGLCDGQIRVFDPQLIDFETVQQFNLTVRIGVDGFSANTTITVVVDILDRNEAPSLAPQTFVVPENSPAGTTVGQALSLLAEDPERDPLMFSIEFDGSDGRVELDSTTGQLSVNHTAGAGVTGTSHPLDFEGQSQAGYFLVIVRLEDIAANTASSFIRIELSDTNDAPELPLPDTGAASNMPQAQVLIVDEVQAQDTSGAVALDPAVQASDQDVGNFTSPLMFRFTSKGAAGMSALQGSVTSHTTSGGDPVTQAG